MTNVQQQTQQILVENGLDFRIEKLPLVALNKENEQIKSDYFGLLNSKTNQIISTCKEGYTISQNDEIVELVLRGMEKFGNELNVSKAGSLNGGRKVFLQLAINGKAKVGNDILTQYVTVIDSNDGSTSLSIGIGDICMRCSNQFFKFYAKGNAKFRHTETIEKKMREIPYLIELALNNSIKQIELYNKFQSTEISRNLANDMVKHLLGYDKVLTSVETLSEKSTRAINIMDTIYNDIETEFNQVNNNLWALLGGITRYTTHNISVPKRDNARIESLLGGNAYNFNQKALEFATDFIS